MPDLLLEIAVRGADDPDVDLHLGAATEAAELPLLQDAEELRLQLEQELPISSRNSVPLCASSVAEPPLVGAGERASLVPKSSDSMRVAGIAPQFTATNGFSLRGEVVDRARDPCPYRSRRR